jgi:hypothetical protein
MQSLWNSGDSIALRGVINDRLWSAQSVIVVQDTEKESILLLTPGAQCVYPDGYWRWKHGDYSRGTRWDDVKNNTWTLREFVWQTNRILIILEPEKYYATFYFWDHSSDKFSCYYINFQLPYRRSHCGFDTLDLELDIIIDPQFEWRLKDDESYDQAVREGCISESWAIEIESSKQEVLSKISKRDYPFDGTWIDWRPSLGWKPPSLPEQWSKL